MAQNEDCNNVWHHFFCHIGFKLRGESWEHRPTVVSFLMCSCMCVCVWCCVWQLSLFPVIVLNHMTDRVAFTHATRASHQADFRGQYEDQKWSCERCEIRLGSSVDKWSFNVLWGEKQVIQFAFTHVYVWVQCCSLMWQCHAVDMQGARCALESLFYLQRLWHLNF